MSEVVSTATLFADDLRAKPGLIPYLVGYRHQHVHNHQRGIEEHPTFMLNLASLT